MCVAKNSTSNPLILITASVSQSVCLSVCLRDYCLFEPSHPLPATISAATACCCLIAIAIAIIVVIAAVVKSGFAFDRGWRRRWRHGAISDRERPADLLDASLRVLHRYRLTAPAFAPTGQNCPYPGVATIATAAAAIGGFVVSAVNGGYQCQADSDGDGGAPSHSPPDC